MKKIIILFLAFTVFLSVTACSKKEVEPKEKEVKLVNLEDLRGEPLLIDDKKYIPAHNDIPQGKKPLTIYFPDNNYMFLIPVTRFINENSDIFKSCIKELQKGADEYSGLSPYSPIGEINDVSYKDRMVTVDLSSKDPKYAMGSTGAMVYLGSLVRSYGEIPGVEQIQFLVDGKKVESIFHGSTDDNKPYVIRKHPEAYIILETENRLYLLPAPNFEPFKTNVSEIEDFSKELFSILQSGKKYGDFQLKPTVPKDVELIKIKHEGNILNLEFNESFKQSLLLKGKINFALLDSLIYTFTSIPGINEIKLGIEGESLKELNNVKFPESFKRYVIINNSSL